MIPTKDYHSVNTAESVRSLSTNPESGLNAADITKRTEQYGANRLAEAKRTPLIIRLLAQFKDFLVIILIIAAVISITIGGDWLDGIIIIAILIVNVIIGLVQENKADNALRELKAMSAPKAKVLRDGVVEKIDSADLVPGDIIILDAGDYIPADLRILESINLRIDESALTGESHPVEKSADAILPADAPLGDRINLAFMGTVVNYGRGRGMVVATGMNTEMGKIATILNQVEDVQTPLQIKLDHMAKKLGIVLVITCAIIFGIGFLYNMPLMEMFMVSVSLAVAAVPEGIAIVTTMILAIGVHRMVRSNVIVKKMRAVETLGSTTVICSDKTGTLTQNKMTVVKVSDEDNSHNIAEIGMLCNDAILGDGGKIIGDPTEAAILAYATKLNISANTPRIAELPFDSDRKLMSTYNDIDGKIVMHTKGAPDEVLRRCTHYLKNGKISPITDDVKHEFAKQNESFAKEALRVLGFAYREIGDESAIDNTEQDLIFAGMLGMIDPPRDEAADAVARCHKAGINVKMITGDHKITATAIARQLGIIDERGEALEGIELNSLNDDELAEKVKTTNVFARVSPEHKVRIVTAIKAGGNIVAMTGDGVNDAPSLKKADIGIAMGITGTDVSKEAADMILSDDNFASIVGAVEQGRTIYNNIRKVVGYLLSANIGEILIILLAIIFNLPVPLVATQLLFVNLLTDAFPAFALGMEGKEAGTMDKAPRDPKEPIINKVMRKTVIYKCIFLSVGVLSVFVWGLHFYDIATARTLAFFTLVASELLVTYAARTERFIGFKRELFANSFLNRSILLSFVILFATVYVPALNPVFHTVMLPPMHLVVAFGFSLIPILGAETSKLIFKTTLQPK
ncbi:MAG: calcium-translocating P-type ATPase, PMCA-type [Defluviitaleaceae bacterium]|nr:calcium-translocating P-type ATPase, PMCA-type [Defluviitaleaceae bacterium]